MKSHIPIDSKLKKELLLELKEEMDAQYMEGQRAQRDLDMLALHVGFGFGAERLNRFNDLSNKLVDANNQWLSDDPKDGAKIARDLVKSQLEQIKGVKIGD